MSWNSYFNFGTSSGANRNAGLNKKKNDYNMSHSEAEKEQKVKSVMNVLKGNEQRNSTPEENEVIPISDIEGFSGSGNFGATIDTINSYIYATERTKEQRMATYREMARYPEVSFALSEYRTEAVNIDENGNFAVLHIDNKAIVENENARKVIEQEWLHLDKEVMKSRRYIHEWFDDFLIDGEFGFEKVIDETKPERGVVRAKRLRPNKLHAVWDSPEENEASVYLYKTENNAIVYYPEMIAYVDQGKYEYNMEEDDKIPVSFLENAKVTYRRLKQVEDALIIYRLVRAPERRIFEINVEGLPKAKAEAYIKELKKSYRQREFWDPKTGQVNQEADVMAMTEDFWLPRWGDGKGPSISTLPGGENLGQIADVEHFLNKLFRSLEVPIRRFIADTGFSIGDTSDITQEEVKFMKRIDELSNRFVTVFEDLLYTHLELKGIVDEYGIKRSEIRLEMNSNNLFKKHLEAKELELRFESVSHFTDFMPDAPSFSAEFIFKKFGVLTATEWEENQEKLMGELEDQPEDEDEV